MKFVIVILVILLIGVGILFQYWGERTSGGYQVDTLEHPASEHAHSKTAKKAEEKPGLTLKDIDKSKLATTASGLQYQDVKAGTGPSPKKGDTVAVHYTGWLTNGKKFDSSLDRGEPFEFQLGAGRVIKGWDEGVASMKVGGKRRLVIPPKLGYGSEGTGGTIPPNATLIFEIELLKIK